MPIPASTHTIVDSAGITLRLSVRFDRIAGQAATGSLALIHRNASAGSMRCSFISIEHRLAFVASSFDAAMPNRNGFAAATDDARLARRR